MTTFFDSVDTASSTSAMPGQNSQGYQTWNPAVGRYFKPASGKRESYGGIIGALQDNQFRGSNQTKSYPENFAGIIAAIQDLGDIAYNPGSDIGPKPPGGNVIIDINGFPIWEETEKPKDGQLWFDTRQGRLFVWVEDDWYQTNGADGLPIVTDDGDEPGTIALVPGQFWWNEQDNVLYIFDGTYILPGGIPTNDPTLGGDPVWKFVAAPDESDLQNTATLPLITAFDNSILDDSEYLPDFDSVSGQMLVQKDYNEWLLQSLLNIDKGIQELIPVVVSETPPDAPEQGQLWYDISSLEMSIWYVDNDGGQWVPTSVAYSYNEALATLSATVETEVNDRTVAIRALYEHIANLDSADDAEVQQLKTEVQTLQSAVSQIPSYDLSPYQLTTNSTSQYNQLNNKITALENNAPDYSLLIPRTELEAAISQLTASVATKVSQSQLQAVASAVPNEALLAKHTDVAAAIAGITVDYLPRDGGVVNGSFIVNKTSYDEPAFDFSQESWSSVNALKFKTNSPAEDTATFGTTPHAYEYAWNFSSNEDFCWVYNDTNKVFSITSEGPACSTIYFGDIQQNDNNGRVIFNKIDVKERLNTYQTAFEQVRQGVANATDFDSLKANIISALASV